MISTYYKCSFDVGCPKVCSAWNKLIAAATNSAARRMPAPSETGVSDESDIVVSLTSFPARFPALEHTLKPLLRQTVKPAKVVLWLCEDELTDGIPSFLNMYKEHGLEIRYCKENIKPHKKLFFSAKEFINYRIITVDDDTIYPEDLVERLDAGSRLHPDCVCCNMAHRMTWDDDGRLRKYDDWDGGAIGLQGPSLDLLALGVGGVLYPAGIFDEDYFDLDAIKRLALSTDDLWLRFYESRKRIKVFKVSAHAKNPIDLKGYQDVSLTTSNNSKTECRNDKNIALLEAEYGLRRDNQ